MDKKESKRTGADPEIFERGGPEAIIYKILERGGPKSVKMAFECLFQSFSYNFFANIPPKGGAQAPWAPPLNPPLTNNLFLSLNQEQKLTIEYMNELPYNNHLHK